MNKQEEIRKKLLEIKLGGNIIAGDLFLGSKDVVKILAYLHSQGVVRKTKCLDCNWSQFNGEMAGMTPCYSCNSTGYIYEPLIEEE